jgi:hypothetical protein
MSYRDAAQFVGTALALGHVAILLAIFGVAYTNPGKQTTVYVNEFGEANAELVWLLLVVVPLVSYAGYRSLRQAYRDG